MLFPFLFLLFAPPGNSSVLLQQGLLELQHGNLQQAREDLRGASSADPQNGFVWCALAELYLRTQESALSVSAAAQAETYSNGKPLLSHALALYYSRAGQFAKAAAVERRYAESTQTDNAAYGRIARWYLEANDTASAVALAEKAAASDAHTAFELGEILLKRQQFTEAAQFFEAGVGAHAGDAQLTLALGVARYGQRRFEEAIKLFLEVIRADPTLEQPYRFLGRMLDQAGAHLDEIVSRAEAWATKNPDNGDAQLVLAEALLARNPDDARADRLLERSVLLQPANWEAHFQWGIYLEATHQYEAAAEQLETAVRLDSREAMPHYHLGRVYIRLGKTDRANEELSLHQKLTSGLDPDQH